MGEQYGTESSSIGLSLGLDSISGIQPHIGEDIDSVHDHGEGARRASRHIPGIRILGSEQTETPISEPIIPGTDSKPALDCSQPENISSGGSADRRIIPADPKDIRSEPKR